MFMVVALRRERVQKFFSQTLEAWKISTYFTYRVKTDEPKKLQPLGKSETSTARVFEMFLPRNKNT